MTTEYPIYSTLDALSHLDDQNFKIACSANEELQMICEGKFKPGHQKYFGQLTDYLYMRRSEAYFDKSLLKFKDDNTSWKDFYEQVSFLVDNIKKRGLVSWLIARGKLLPLQILYKIKPQDIISRSTINWTGVKGTIEMLNWFKENNMLPDENSALSMVQEGNVNNLKWFQENVGPVEIEQSLVNIAAASGRLEMLKYLFEKGLTPDANGADQAAGNNRVEVLQWMKENNLPLPTRNGVYMATRNANTEVVNWLASQDPPLINVVNY